MRKPISILFAGLTISFAFVACSKPEPAPVEDPAVAAQAQQEQEAARRAEAAKALGGRLASVTASIEPLVDSAGTAQLPSALEESATDLRAKVAEVQSLESQLASATGDAWDTANNRLEEALGDLENASRAAAASLSDWKSREQAAIEARASEGMPIDPQTGLLKGMDGGDYEQYKISVVERVQERLRTLGLYAGPADGVFDVPLRTAVGSFQEQEELPVSGVPSPMTRSRLFSE
jgi:hypothetical protein